MATLLFKVGSLTLKTLSKPLAAKFEGYVMQHPVLRGRVVNLAQVRPSSAPPSARARPPRGPERAVRPKPQGAPPPPPPLPCSACTGWRWASTAALRARRAAHLWET